MKRDQEMKREKETNEISSAVSIWFYYATESRKTLKFSCIFREIRASVAKNI
jgi:hypothetical protein